MAAGSDPNRRSDMERRRGRRARGGGVERVRHEGQRLERGRRVLLPGAAVRGRRGRQEVAPEQRVRHELGEERGGVRDDCRVRRRRAGHGAITAGWLRLRAHGDGDGGFVLSILLGACYC